MKKKKNKELSKQVVEGDTEKAPTDEIDTAVATEDSYRACTAPFTKLMRKDLGTTVQSLIMNKLHSALINTSSFIFCFSSLVQLMMIGLRNNQFFINQGNINMRKVNGFDITTIVPYQFHTDSSPYTIEPLGEDVKNSGAFDADFSQLFQEQHLMLISSQYFGSRGASKQNLTARPVIHIRINSPFICPLVTFFKVLRAISRQRL